MANQNTAIPDDGVEAENTSSLQLGNSTVDHQEYESTAVWGSNQTTNAINPIAILHWLGELHDQTRNSHKQYAVIVIGSTVIRAWGRIAGYGLKATERYKVEEFDSEDSAVTFAHSIINKKTSKGYESVEVNL
tara:strand:- start:246 stop:644 length:399 start_codon:yes stop_codon:yes gene_type:complete